MPLPLPEAIANVRKVIETVNAAEFSRLSGVPYTTIREWQKRGFKAEAVDTLAKMSAAAELYLSQSQAPNKAA